MARIKRKDYGEGEYPFDEWGSPNKPYCVIYEQDGIDFKYFPGNNDDFVYVLGIEKGTEKIVVPEFIDTNYGRKKVTKWNIFTTSGGEDEVKSIEFCKSINEFPVSSCRDSKSLEDVIIHLQVNMPDDFFKNCMKLKNVEFCDDCNITYIDDETFRNCLSLRKITLPKSLRSLGGSEWDEESVPFRGCSNLKTVEIYPNQKHLVERLCENETIERIIVIGGNLDNYYSKELEELRARVRRKKYLKKKKEEEDYKFSSLDHYEEKMSKFRKRFIEILCAPFPIYIGIKNIIGHFSDVFDFWTFIAYLIVLAFVGIGLLISYALSVITCFNIEYKTREKNFLTLLFCPIIIPPISLLVVSFGMSIILMVLGIVSSCQSGVAGIFDPRFL